MKVFFNLNHQITCLNPIIKYLVICWIFTLSFSSYSQNNNSNDTINTVTLENLKNSTKAGNYGFGLSYQLNKTSLLNNFSSVLFVIDDIPYPLSTPNFDDFTTVDEYDLARSAGVPLEDIDEISILTDPSDLSKYGSYGYNGILSIKTKKYSQNKIRLNYSYRTTISTQERGYDVLNGDEYTSLILEGYENTYGSPMNYDLAKEFSYLITEPYYYYNYGQNTDWFDAVTQKGIAHDHYLSLSGSIKDFGYRFSTNYQKESGVIISTGAENYSLNFKTDYNPSEKLRCSFRLNYSNNNTYDYYRDNIESIQEIALKRMPNMSVYEYTNLGVKTSNYFLPVYNAQGSYCLNPAAFADLSKNDETIKEINPVFTFNYQPFKNLRFKSELSYQKLDIKTNKFDPILRSDLPLNIGKYKDSDTDLKLFYLSNQLFYNPFISKWSNLILNASYNIINTKSSTDKWYNGTQGSTINSENIKKLISAQINYSIVNRYFFNFNANSERLKIEDFKSDFLYSPSFTTKWIISNEPLLKHLKFIDHFSLSATHGQYNYTVSQYDDHEKMIKSEMDLSLSVFNRIKFDFNVYEHKYINEFLQGNPIMKSFTQSTKNAGWELNMDLAVVQKQNFKLNLFASIYKNEKTLLDDNYSMNLSNNITGNGYYPKFIDKNSSYGNIFGYKYLGVYQYDEYIPGVQESVPYYVDNGNLIYDLEGNPIPIYFDYGVRDYAFQPGDASYDDLNHDGNINEADIMKIGNAKPKISGTGGLSIQYKNWWLGTFFNFREGNDIVNLARMHLESMGISADGYDNVNIDNQSKEVFKRWRKSGDDTNIPRPLLGYGYNVLGSSRFVEDGSFIRLKVITLKHEVSKKITSLMHLNSLSFYITAKNLFTHTSYQGADPDISLNTRWFDYGFDDNYIAPNREFTLGVTVGI